MTTYQTENHLRRDARLRRPRLTAACDHWTVNLSRTRGGAGGWVSMVPETRLDVIGDGGRVVQELHHHLPRIVENQQRLGRIVGQLACDHYGLEPQVNVFL